MPKSSQKAKTTQTQKNPQHLQEIQTSEEFTPNIRTIIFGDPNHTPTATQTQLLYNYITDEEGRTPTALLRAMGKTPENWWVWPKRYPGFLAWWNKCVNHVFSEYRLNDLYNALYRRGSKHDTAAAKIVIQRFDPRFTERTQGDQRHSFAGYEPKGADSSRDRQRKALRGQGQGIAALPEPTRPHIEHVEPLSPPQATIQLPQGADAAQPAPEPLSGTQPEQSNIPAPEQPRPISDGVGGG